MTMTYAIELERFDPLDRHERWKPLGRMKAECNLGEVAKSIALAVKDAEERHDLSSGEAEFLRKLHYLLS